MIYTYIKHNMCLSKNVVSKGKKTVCIGLSTIYQVYIYIYSYTHKKNATSGIPMSEQDHSNSYNSYNFCLWRVTWWAVQPQEKCSCSSSRHDSIDHFCRSQCCESPWCHHPRQDILHGATYHVAKNVAWSHLLIDVFVFCTHCNVTCFPIKGVSWRLQQFLAFLEVCPQMVLRQCLRISPYRSVVHTGSSLEHMAVGHVTNVHNQKENTRSNDIKWYQMLG